jgi:GntR family transcriptional regulator
VTVKGIPLETGRAQRRGGRSSRHRYEDVIERIESTIADDGLGPGSRLPSNAELAEAAGVSLITVRRALDELEREGVVVRYQGVGTFVARGRIVSEPAKRGDLAQTLADIDRSSVRTTLVDLFRGRPSTTIARALLLEPDEEVWSVTRLRYVQEQPMILERAALPVRLVPALDAGALEAGGSLYAMLTQRHGLVDDSEEQVLALARPSADERAALGLDRDRDVIRIRGVTFDPGGMPFDAFEQIYPADAFVFYISGQTSRRLLPASHGDDWRVTPSP